MVTQDRSYELQDDFLASFGGITSGKESSARQLANHLSYLMLYQTKDAICSSLSAMGKSYSPRVAWHFENPKEEANKAAVLKEIGAKFCNGQPSSDLKSATLAAVQMGSSAPASMVPPAWADALSEHLHRFTKDKKAYCNELKALLPPKVRKSNKSEVALARFVDIVSNDHCSL